MQQVNDMISNFLQQPIEQNLDEQLLIQSLNSNTYVYLLENLIRNKGFNLKTQKPLFDILYNINQDIFTKLMSHITMYANDKICRYNALLVLQTYQIGDLNIWMNKLQDRVCNIRFIAIQYLLQNDFLTPENSELIYRSILSLSEKDQIKISKYITRQQIQNYQIFNNFITVSMNENSIHLFSAQEIKQRLQQKDKEVGGYLLHYWQEQPQQCEQLLIEIFYQQVNIPIYCNSLIEDEIKQNVKLFKFLQSCNASLVKKLIYQSQNPLIAIFANVLSIEQLIGYIDESLSINNYQFAWIVAYKCKNNKQIDIIQNKIITLWNHMSDPLKTIYVQLFTTEQISIIAEKSYENKDLQNALIFASLQGKYPEIGILGNYRRIAGQIASQNYQRLLDQNMTNIQEIIQTLIALDVVLTSPGFNDYKLENLINWIQSCLQDFSIYQQTFLRDIIYQNQNIQQNSQLLIIYNAFISDLLQIILQISNQEQKHQYHIDEIVGLYQIKLYKILVYLFKNDKLQQQVNIQSVLNMIFMTVQKLTVVGHLANNILIGMTQGLFINYSNLSIKQLLINDNHFFDQLVGIIGQSNLFKYCDIEKTKQQECLEKEIIEYLNSTYEQHQKDVINLFVYVIYDQQFNKKQKTIGKQLRDKIFDKIQEYQLAQQGGYLFINQDVEQFQQYQDVILDTKYTQDLNRKINKLMLQLE